MVRISRQWLLSRLTPDGALKEQDTLAMRRAELVILATVLVAGAILIWSPLEWILVGPTTGLISLVAGLCMLSPLLIFRLTRSVTATSMVLTMLFLITTFVVTWAGGGHGLQTLVALVALPVVPGLLIGGWRAPVATAGAIALVVWGYQTLYLSGEARSSNISAAEVEAVTYHSIVFLAFAVALTSVLFDRLRRQALTREREVSADLTQALARAEEAVKHQDAFVARVSHELRTPLNGVLANLDLIGEALPEGAAQSCLEDAEASGRLLRSLVEDLLHTAAMQSGRLVLTEAPFQLASVIRRVARVIGPLAREKGLTLHLEGPEQPAPLLLGDAERLTQVITNLASNAVKFTGEGSVRLRWSWRLTEGRVQVELSVQDTGPGVPEAHRSRIFERFERGQTATPGTGLGLSIARGLVEQMGGTLTLEPAEQIGATFTLRCHWPVAETAELEVIEALPTLSGLVLVAEDNPVNQRVICRMLERLGCTVSLVAEGRAALAQVSESPPDVVLMDCQMPEMDGYEATRRIRALPGPASTMPVIAITANAGVGARRRCVEAGMNAVLAKPVQLQALAQMLSAHLQ